MSNLLLLKNNNNYNKQQHNAIQTNWQYKISHLFRAHNGKITKKIVFITASICGLSLLVLSFAPRGFSLDTPVFLSFSKTNISKFQFNQESGRRRTTLWMYYPQIFIYLFIYLQLTKFTKMNVWVYYLYWSNKYPVGPDDPICRVATMKRNQTEIDDEKFPVVPDENKR